MKKKINDRYYLGSDLADTDWYQYIIGDTPDYIDVYSINDSYAKMDLKKIISLLDADSGRRLLAESAARLEKETGCETRYEGTNLIIEFTSTNVAEVDEYDYGGNFAEENTLPGIDMYFSLSDVTDIMRKKLNTSFKFTENPNFSCEVVKYPTEFQEGEIYGDFNQSVEFRATGEDFAKTKIADKMWHVVYHVLEDYDMLDAIVEDDTQSMEMVESNVYAAQAGLFTGELVITEIGVYFETDIDIPTK